MDEKKVVWPESTLICDKCGIESLPFTIDINLVKKKCILCGFPLLTQKEYDQHYVHVLKVTDWINKYLSWVPWLTCTYKDSKAGRAHKL